MGHPSPNGKINVLVVDDSQVSRMFLTHLLESDPKIHVLGSVNDGQAAFDFVSRTKPDVVLMDIHMPRLDGFEATRRIMETRPVPIVICTATANAKDLSNTFRVMEAGAVACVEKPTGREHPNFEQLATHLLQTIKLMSEVKVVRRWPKGRLEPALESLRSANSDFSNMRIVGIGASTGGPSILQAILSELPKDFSAPILIVQHISRGFLPGMTEWLNQTTSLQIQIAAHGTVPQAGHVYVAPDDYHMGLLPSGRIILSHEEPENGLRPSVSYLFRTLATVSGPKAIGVLLTGMGKDGAAELKLMKDAGAVTIAQDADSSVVHGMPGEALRLGAAMHELSPEEIVKTLITLVTKR